MGMSLSFSILFIWNHLTNYHFWDNKKTISGPQISFWQEQIRRRMVKALTLIYAVILSTEHKIASFSMKTGFIRQSYQVLAKFSKSPPSSLQKDIHPWICHSIRLYAKCIPLYNMHQFCLHVINKDVNFIEEEDTVEWRKEMRRRKRGWGQEGNVLWDGRLTKSKTLFVKGE